MNHKISLLLEQQFLIKLPPKKELYICSLVCYILFLKLKSVNKIKKMYIQNQAISDIISKNNFLVEITFLLMRHKVVVNLKIYIQ